MARSHKIHFFFICDRKGFLKQGRICGGPMEYINTII